MSLWTTYQKLHLSGFVLSIFHDLLLFFHRKVIVVVIQSLSRVQLFETPRTVAHQVSLCMRFSRQEYWSGLTFPPPGNIPDPDIEPASPALAGELFTTEQPGKLKCFFKTALSVGLWRKLSAKKLMVLNYGVGEDSWESLGLQGDPASPF